MGLRELARKREELQEALRQEGEKAVVDELRKLFEEFPALKKVGWHQYTPYFNDGDPCYFSVHEPTFKIGDDDEPSDYEGSIWDWEYARRYRPPDRDPLLNERMLEISRLWQQNPELFEAAFGDHARIVADRNGVHVEQYHHD
jgi:hypothetical protein